MNTFTIESLWKMSAVNKVYRVCTFVKCR